MKASEVYQKFIEEYRKANVIPENNAIEDGDMMDFICERIANNYFSNPFVMQSSSAKNQDDHLYKDYINSGKLKKQLGSK